MSRPAIDRDRFLADFAALAQIGRTPDGGVHRVAYSEADRAGRIWLKREFDRLEISHRDDPAGSTIGQLPGRDRLPPLAIGSHTDSVPHGGAYDGALGIIAALAVARALLTAGHQLRHPLEVINFAAEEATMAGGTTGSQAMAGLFNPELLDKKAWDGRPVRDHLAGSGLDPARVGEARRPKGSLAAYVELHIEQSTRLETGGIDIAIVDGFVGIRRYAVSVPGRANHAGTTPMEQRQDALVAAAPLARWVHELAVELGIVATIGDFRVFPGAPNVIPGRVDLIVETRGLKSPILNAAEAELLREVGRLGASCTPVVSKPPVAASPQIMAAIAAGCRRLNLSHLTLSSGAGHDAMVMAAICPQGMLFVPSRDGISHAPDEFTAETDCLNGASLLLETVLELDDVLP